jgi:hypothetical protein
LAALGEFIEGPCFSSCYLLKYKLQAVKYVFDACWWWAVYTHVRRKTKCGYVSSGTCDGSTSEDSNTDANFRAICGQREGSRGRGSCRCAHRNSPTSKHYTYVDLRSDNGKRTCNEDLESKHIGALWQDTNLEETYCTNLNALTHRSIRLARRILKRRMTHKPCASIRRAVKRLQ